MTPTTFLIVFADQADAVKIDKGIESKKLGCDKLGDRSYVGTFLAEPDVLYAQWKREWGIAGKADWIRLPFPLRTE